MIELALLRHAPTQWNREKRIQGRTDIPVLPEALADLRRLTVPLPYAGWDWYCSPLLRAGQTAAALGLQARAAPQLIETDWGTYEGETIDELVARHGAAFRDNEDRGLDFQPPGGESPRQVQQRLAPWLRDIAAGGRNAGAVTHKGVIRALMALACGWSMLGKPPVKLNWQRLQVLRIGADGQPQPGAWNIALPERAV